MNSRKSSTHLTVRHTEHGAYSVRKIWRILIAFTLTLVCACLLSFCVIILDKVWQAPLNDDANCRKWSVPIFQPFFLYVREILAHFFAILLSCIIIIMLEESWERQKGRRRQGLSIRHTKMPKSSTNIDTLDDLCEIFGMNYVFALWLETSRKSWFYEIHRHWSGVSHWQIEWFGKKEGLQFCILGRKNLEKVSTLDTFVFKLLTYDPATSHLKS